jgi:hypothetical protein
MGTLQSADSQTHSWRGSSALCFQCQVVHASYAWTCAASSLIRPSDLDLRGYLARSAPGVSSGGVFVHTGCCENRRLVRSVVLRWPYRRPSPVRLEPSAQSLVTTSAGEEGGEAEKKQDRLANCLTAFAFADACVWKALRSAGAREARQVLQAALFRPATSECPCGNAAVPSQCTLAAEACAGRFVDGPDSQA